MLSRLWKLFERIESDETPLKYWLASFFAIILLRNLLEGLLGSCHCIFPPRPFFVSFPLPYILLFLALAILLKVVTRIRTVSLMKVLVLLFSLLLIVPVIDYFAYGGEGTRLGYLDDSGLASDFLTFYSGTGVTTGQKIEAITFGLLLLAYMFFKTKSAAKATAGLFLAYCILFAVAALPPLTYAVVHPLFGAPPASAPPDAYGKELYTAYKSGLPVTLFITIAVAAEIALLLAISQRQKFVLLLKAIRPFRSAHYVLLGIFGILLGVSATDGWKYGFYGVFAFCYMVSVFFAYQFACLINDFFDRDLHVRTKSKQSDSDWRAVKLAAIMYLALSILIAVSIGYDTLVFLICFVAVAFLYSAPPLSLKRYPIVASFALATCALFIILGGFAVFSRGDSATFPLQVAIMVLVVYTLGTNCKDLKDVKSDRERKVYSLPVLLGERRGRFLIAVMTLSSFLLVPFILNISDLVLPSVVGGLLSVVLIARNDDERIFRAMHLFYFILVMYYLV